jgi:hypothetical protein
MNVFDFESVSLSMIFLSLGAAFVGVFWIEIWKFFQRKKGMSVKN